MDGETFVALAGMAGAITVGYAHYVEPRRIGIRELEVPAPRLTEDLTILHISDFHLRDDRYWDRKVSRLLSLLRAIQCDVVLFSGDFLERESGLSTLERILAELPAAKARYAVWGNHDYYHYTLYHLFAPKVYKGIRWDRTGLERILEKYRVTILDNDHTLLRWGASEVVIVGVHDYYAREHNLAKAFLNCPKGDLTILLTHSPEIVTLLPPAAVDLVLSGHTHGGQIRIPGFGPIASRSQLPKQMIAGVYDHNGITVMVNNGLGEGKFIPFRLCSPPELVRIRLRATASSP